jgi:hypothetical protein
MLARRGTTNGGSGWANSIQRVESGPLSGAR